MSNSQSQGQAEASEKPQQKPQVLEEDDEFEDFPVEGSIPPSFDATRGGKAEVANSY